MAEDGASAWPEPWWLLWLTHRSMVTKWLLAAGLLAATVLLVPAGWWWLLPAGFLAWFPWEYINHRWIFHALVEHPRWNFLATQHWQHHLDPEEIDPAFVDIPRTLVTAAMLYPVFALVAWDPLRGLALLTGSMVGLIYYEYMHLLAHAPGVTPRLPWTRAMKKWHLLHHYKHEDHWFGVTNRAIDQGLGTGPDPGQVDKSQTVRTLGVPEALGAWLGERGALDDQER